MNKPAKTAAKRLPLATPLAEAAPVYLAIGPELVALAHADQPSDPAADFDEAAAGVETLAEPAHDDHGSVPVAVGSIGLPVAELSGMLVHSVALATSVTLTVTVTVEGLAQAEHQMAVVV